MKERLSQGVKKVLKGSPSGLGDHSSASNCPLLPLNLATKGIAALFSTLKGTEYLGRFSAITVPAHLNAANVTDFV